MNTSNIRKGFYNLLTSVLGQLITIVLGIVIPRLVLVSLGSEVNGLLSSITQALGYASLLEAGVGLASIQALYGPIAKGNQNDINAIMSATQAYYRRTGILYFIAVVVLAFVFPLVVESTIDKLIIIAVIIISGLPGVINYSLQGKYKILLQAEGKNYIVTNLTTITGIFTSIGKIVLLLLGFGVVAVQLLYLLISLAQMIYISLYIKKNYKWLNLNVKPAYDKVSQSKAVLKHQMSGLVFNNTDTVLLSIFCGLSTVSVYSMYAMLFGMIGTLLSNIGNSVTFALGQQLYVDKGIYEKKQDAFELIYITISFCLVLVAKSFITPFLKLYTQGVNDIRYIDRTLPIMFAAIALLENSRLSSAKTIHVAGHFSETQSHAIIEMMINIVVSIIGVIEFGLYGVIAGTIAALLFRANAMIIYANKKILNRSPWKTYRRWLVNLGMFIAFTLISKVAFAHVVLDTYPRIILWAAISCVVVIPTFFVVASLCDIETYRYAKALLMPYLHKAWCKLTRKPQAD